MNFKAKPMVVRRAPQAWYIQGVNINYSFKTLEALAIENGADIGNGDVLIVDNARGDKRKAFKKTANGCVIVYVGLLNNNIFEPLENGRIDNNVPLIDFFQA